MAELRRLMGALRRLQAPLRRVIGWSRRMMKRRRRRSHQWRSEGTPFVESSSTLQTSGFVTCAVSALSVAASPALHREGPLTVGLREPPAARFPPIVCPRCLSHILAAAQRGGTHRARQRAVSAEHAGFRVGIVSARSRAFARTRYASRFEERVDRAMGARQQPVSRPRSPRRRDRYLQNLGSAHEDPVPTGAPDL